MTSLRDAPSAPRGLLFAATFNAAERAEIAGHPELFRAIRAAEPSAWAGIIAEHRDAQRCALAVRAAHLPADADGMRRQALDDLHDAAEHLTGLNDGRRNALFTTACRLAKYVSNHVLSDPEVRAALRDAAAANGTVARYGARFVDGVITRALRKGAGDLLPPLARRFRTNGGRA